MPRNTLAADGEQENGETILVDSDAKEGQQVTRRAPRTAARPVKDDTTDEWATRSKAVQKRLAKQARAFDQRLADVQAENQRELAARDERIARLERGGGDTQTTDEAAHARVMDDFEKKIAEAQELGDSAAVAKLTRQMTEADGKYWAAKTTKQAGTDPNAGRQAAAAKTPAPNGVAPTKEGQKWANANKGWFDDKHDPICVAARALSNALYKEKMDDGEDRDDPQFYEDIRREVAKRYPELETVSTHASRGGDDDEDEDDDEVEERRQPVREVRKAPSVSLPNRGDPLRSRPNRLATITSAEQRLMRQVNLDPNNNKHVLQWLESRNEMDATQ